jgi:hypothetical protein
MKTISAVFVICSVVSLILGILAKSGNSLILGVGPTGYLNTTMVLLLFGANFSLIELLKRK